ncbi:DUF2933 domain-containing protein [Variovorax sp. EBFNA2]|uniref:DUF2933 domain-containing protein n=1 Tax=Variovorax sp. EBFNA2 TaxID=3342097 RepID=UPI0029BFADC5|nr:DUF2933 domain-containing protein [Variovorax boronicumulans]WPG41373.1 DUF2933 domain-containing protein [Variovorax boronicumulans]
MLLVVSAVVGFLLFTEHRAYVLGVLPFALLLACPLMHIFMHPRSRHWRCSQCSRRCMYG